MRKRLTTRWGAAAVALTTGVVLTACSAGGDDVAGGGGDGGAAPADSGQMLEVTGTDGLAFEPSQVTVTAGEVTVELTSQPAAPHTFTIEELDDREVVQADAGETARGTIELDPGTYTYYCSVPGHRQAGMEGRLTVQ